MVGKQFNAVEHYRQQYRDAEERQAFLLGIILGIAAGLIWEAIRR